MNATDDVQQALGSLRAYLEELQETGVDYLSSGIPRPAIPAPPVKAPSQVPSGSSPESLDAIRLELGDCRRCDLSRGRKNLVFGVGNPNARLVFVGEAPGKDEDIQGEPFVGEAGQLLNRLITRMGLARGDVYICNVLKCRPPGNRNPEPGEIAQCAPFMLRQVQAIDPDVIVALGTFAAQTLLDTKAPISRLRGKFHDYHGIPLMPTFHPSFLLHNKKDTHKFWDVWEDMVEVLKKLELPVPDVQRQKP